MDDVREATEGLLAEKPETESVLRALLAVDVDADGPWTFEDVPADSGTFGEIVARGIAEDRDGGYRLADRSAVRRALDDEYDAATPARDGADGGVELPARPGLSALPELPAVPRRVALALGGLLALLVGLRLAFAVPAVMRNGDVVLAGNDPWFYRYWVEELLRGETTAFTPGGLSALPEGLATQDVLLLVGLWWATALLGGGAWTAGFVVATYPVIAAVLTGLVLYVLLVRLTADRRIALAGLAMLAVTPVHALRTMFGFGDHHAFDYLLLAITALALVVAAQTWRPTDDADWIRTLQRLFANRTRRWAIVGIGVGVGAQTLAWRGAPLLLFPLAVYAVALVLSALRTDRPPLRAALPLLVGLILGGVLTLVPHVAFGWLGTIRATLPLVLAAGVLIVGAMTVGVRRADASPRVAVGGTVLAGVASFALAWLILPGFAALGRTFVTYVSRTGQRNIAETQSIAAAGVGSIFGPVLLFGFVLFLALAVAVYYAWRLADDHHPDWLVLVTYTVYFAALALIQQRFAGELSVFSAALAGVGFLHLAAAVDLASAPSLFREDDPSLPAVGGVSDEAPGNTLGIGLPDRRTAISVLVLFALVVNVGFVQIPIKQGQVATGDQTYETATWIEEYASDRGEAYPDNYVFSDWGNSRLYNYVVNDHADSYTFARDNYQAFVRSMGPGDWYQRLRHRPGYVVMYPGDNAPAESIQATLFQRFGSRGQGAPGLGHYRAIHITEDVRAFDIVPGATMIGSGPANERLTTSVQGTVDGQSITYSRVVETQSDGAYALTVPYPGVYTLGNRTWTVEETAIVSNRTDERLLVDESVYVGGEHRELGRWQFDLPLDVLAFDRLGRRHGEIHGTVVNQSGARPSLVLDGENDLVALPNPGHETRSMTVSMWFRTGEDFEPRGDHAAARLLSTSGPGRFDQTTDGYQLGVVNGGLVGAVGNGSGAGVVHGRNVAGGDWRHVALRYNLTHVTLYFEGNRRKTVRYEGGRSSVEEVVLGATTADTNHFAGEIDDVRIYDQALTDHQLRSVYLDGRHEN